jgi:hypothetical protein
MACPALRTDVVRRCEGKEREVHEGKGDRRGGSGWNFKGSLVRLWAMGYVGFLLLSFLVATGYAKPKAVYDLEISKSGVKA